MWLNIKPTPRAADSRTRLTSNNENFNHPSSIQSLSRGFCVSILWNFQIGKLELLMDSSSKGSLSLMSFFYVWLSTKNKDVKQYCDAMTLHFECFWSLTGSMSTIELCAITTLFGMPSFWKQTNTQTNIKNSPD